jgi:hypothetical protein
VAEIRGNVTAREVLIQLQSHIESCANWSKVHVAFMGAVLSVLLVFAGYTYVHEQQIAEQLTATQMQDAKTLAQIPARTAQAVSATTSAANSN